MVGLRAAFLSLHIAALDVFLIIGFDVGVVRNKRGSRGATELHMVLYQ